MSSTKVVVAFVILFLMLGIIWWPTFTNLGDLFTYAENAQYQGVSLLNFFKAELIILITIWVYLISYKKSKDPIDGDSYVRKHLLLISLIIGQVFMGFFAGGFLVHQDAAWFQLIHGADDVMPAQAVILLVCYPLYLFFGGNATLYTSTRLPKFFKNKQVAFLVLVFAPFTFLPFFDSSLVDNKTDFGEIAYLVAYWVLSTVWAVVGVIYLIIKSTQEILRGLKDPYGEM